MPNDDADTSDTHTYTLVDTASYPDNASFTIDGDKLKTAEVLDYETKNNYTIRVQADDGHSETYKEVFVIIVTDGANLSIAATDTSKHEGDAGDTAFIFTVTRSGDTTGTITVQWAVSGSGMYQADSDDFGFVVSTN